MRKYVAPQSQPQPQVEEEVAQQTARRKRQRGFTLIEMLAVVVILAIVAGVGFVVVNQQIENARGNTDEANIRTILDAAQRYILDGNNASNLAPNQDTPVDNNHILVTQHYLGAAPQNPWNGESDKNYKITVDTTNKIITVKSPHGGTNARSRSVNY